MRSGDSSQSEAFNAIGDQTCYFSSSWSSVFQSTATEDGFDVEDLGIEEQLLCDVSADENIDGIDQLLDEEYEQKLWKDYAPWIKAEQHAHVENEQVAPKGDQNLQGELDNVDTADL
jgi:hypothetical protein